MKVYRRAIPDHLRSVPAATAAPRVTMYGGSVTAGSSRGDAGNPFAEYACGKPAPNKPPKYMRRARPDAPEWYGLEDDGTLVQIWERLGVRDGHKHRRLSKQMRRVCTRALEKQLGLSPEQACAFSDAVCGKNVFLSGGAGVGKSHTLTQIVKHLPSGAYAGSVAAPCLHAHSR